MNVAVKKSVLFSLLKNNLSEGFIKNDISNNFTTLFDEEDDAPIAPSEHVAPHRQVSIGKVPVENPSWKPSGSEELHQAANLIIREIPLDDQSKIKAFYRGLHVLLDDVLYESIDNITENTETFNISSSTTINDFNLVIESIEETDFSAYDNREPLYGEYKFDLEEGQSTVINFDNFSKQDAISALQEIKLLELKKLYDDSNITYKDVAELKADVDISFNAGYDFGEAAMAAFPQINQVKDINDQNVDIKKIFSLHIRKTRNRQVSSLKNNLLFQIGIRLGMIEAINSNKEAANMSDDYVDEKYKEVVDSPYRDDDEPLSPPTERQLNDPKYRDVESIKDAEEDYGKIAQGANVPEDFVRARTIIETTFFEIMQKLGREDNAYYMTMVASDGWKKQESTYKNSFPLHKQYGVNFFKKLLGSSDQQRFIFGERDNPEKAKAKFESFINELLNNHFFKLKKGGSRFKELKEICENMDKPINKLIELTVEAMAEDMFNNASKLGMRDPETGEIIKDDFIKKYIQQVFGSSRSTNDMIEKYNKYFQSKGVLKRNMKKYREITFMNFCDKSDLDFLNSTLLERIYELAEDDPNDSQKMIIKFTRYTLNPERPNYTDELSVSESDIESHVKEFFQSFVAAAEDYQAAKVSKIELKRQLSKKTLTPKEIRAINAKQKEAKKRRFEGLGKYLEQNSSSGGRQEFVRYPNVKYIYGGGEEDINVGWVNETKSWLLVDFIDSVYDMVTPRLIKKLEKYIKRIDTSGAEEKNSKGFVKKPAGYTLYTMLTIAKTDLEKINKIIISSSFKSIDIDNALYRLMYTVGGSLLRNLVNNVVNECVKAFNDNLISNVADSLKKYMKELTGVSVKGLSNDDYDGLAEYFIGLKNRPRRLDFQTDKRNSRAWKELGIDYNGFEALYQYIFNEEVVTELIGFYHTIIPIIDGNGDFVNYDLDPDDTADIYAEKARQIVEDIDTKDEVFNKAIVKAVSEYVNYENTRKEYEDDPLKPVGINDKEE